jgi:hypothetical protein
VAALPPDGDRVTRTVDLLASLFTGRLFAAAIEVWVAARSDASLRAVLLPVETRFGREVHRLSVELLGADESRPGVRESVQATLDLMRGLGVASLLTDDSARRQRLLAEWSRQLASTLADPAVTDPAAAPGSAAPGSAAQASAAAGPPRTAGAVDHFVPEDARDATVGPAHGIGGAA